MLFALVAITAWVLSLPAIATSQEIHLESGTGTQFGGNANSTTALKASGEPTITCGTYFVEGELTSETTAKLGFDLYECHITILGVTQHCHSSGSPLINTIGSINVAHLITTSSGAPGILVTPPFPTVICGTGLAERKIQITGSGLIGTVTSPGCNTSNGSLTLSFKTNGSGGQEHVSYTGNTYDLLLATEGGSDVTAGLEGEFTLSLVGKSLKLICT